MSPPVPEHPDRYVFISFASGDTALAHRALAALEGAGLRCWIADRDIKVATSYPAAIGAAIKGSGAMLLLLTETSNSSPHVLREVELAFNARRPIAPVRIAGVQPSSDLQYFLSTSQWLDAGSAFDEEDLAKIEPVLRDLLEHGPGPGFAPGDTSRRGWLWMAAVLALTGVVAAGAMFWTREARRAAGAQGAPVAGGAAARTGSPDAVASTASARRDPAASAVAAPVPTRPAMKTNPADGQAYAWIPPGQFVMGCSEGDPECDRDEKPAHPVTIARGFWLARTEVTEAQYRKATPRGALAETTAATLPVTGVSWSGARAYCARVGGRLPTEAEWEYAARAGTKTRSYDSLDTIAWYAANGDDHSHPVGTKPPNAFGLHDMLGNVSEWVLDRYFNAYDDTSDASAPELPLAGNASAVARGGSWVSDAGGVRVSRRLEMPPDAEEPHIGFRCAIDRL